MLDRLPRARVNPSSLRAVRRLGSIAIVALAAWLASGAHGGLAWDQCTAKGGDITFRAPDRTKLAGHLFGSGTTGVVLAHQSDGTMCQWVPYAQRLAKLGYRVLVFDFRNAGDSQPRGYPANIRYGGDVAGAAAELRRRGVKKVFLVGASLGGSAVLQAAANVRPQVAGVVSVSGAADLSNAIASVPGLRVRVLYLAGSGDVDFAHDARRLYAATREQRKKIVVLDDFRHGTALVGGNAQARRLIEQFLAG
jgi:pimeloyl-ACP methyl ester carboxylesterase